MARKKDSDQPATPSGNKLLQEQLEKLTKKRDLTQEIKDLEEDLEVIAKDLLDIASERGSLSQAMAGTRQDALTFDLEHLQIKNMELEKEIKIFDLQAEKNDQLLAQLKKKRRKSKLDKKAIEDAEKENDSLKKQKKNLEEILKTQKETRAEIEKKLTAQKANDDILGSIAIKLGLSAKSSDSMLGKVIGVGSGFIRATKKAGGLRNMMKQMTKSFLDVFSLTNLISAAIGAMMKATLEFIWASSKAQASFSATSGTAGEMASSVSGAMNLAAGVDIAEAGKAAEGLAGSFTELTSASKEDARSMIQTAAELERLGISASTTGKNMTFLTKAMGMSTKQAESKMKGLATAASTLGKTPKQLADDFASAAGTLSAQGPKMEEVFFRLQGFAKKAGMEMKTVLGIADKFDSFESAADSVGSLNAILGGDYLNSVEMMAMTEDERVEAVKRAIDMSGRSYDQMERFERKAVAKQLGIDTAQLAQMMGVETEESKKAAEEAAKKARQQEKYNKMINMTVDLLTRFKLMFASIFRKKSLMDAILNVFNKFFAAIKKNEKKIARALGTIAEVMAVLIDFLANHIDDIFAFAMVFFFIIKPILLVGKVLMFLLKPLRLVGKAFSWAFGKNLDKGAKKISRFSKYVFRPLKKNFLLLKRWILKTKVGKWFAEAWKGAMKFLGEKSAALGKFFKGLPMRLLRFFKPSNIIGMLKKITIKGLGMLLAVFDFAYILNTLLPDNVIGEGSLAKKLAAIPTAIIKFFTLGLMSDDTYKAIMDGFLGIFDWISETVEEWANSDNVFVSIIGNYLGFVGTLWANTMGLLVDGLAYVGHLIERVFTDFSGMWDEFYESMAYLFGEQIPGLFWGIVKSIKDTAVEIYEAFMTPFRWIGTNLLDPISEGWDKVVAWFSGSPLDSPNSRGGKLGAGLISGIINPLKDFGKDAGKVLSEGWDKVVSWFSGSPLDSKTAEGGKLGTGIAEGIVNAIKSEVESVRTAFAEMWAVITTDAIEKFKEITESVNLLVSAFNSMPNQVVADFAYGMNSFLVPASKITNPDAPIKVIKEATKYQKEVAANKDNVDALAQVLKASQPAAGAGGGGMPEKMIIELDGRPLRTLVNKTRDAKIARYGPA